MSTTKAIKGERKRERKREIEIEPSALDWNSRARTKHNISKFPNSQNPKVEIETQIDYPTLKNSIHERERERERNREIEIEASQFAFHKHGVAARWEPKLQSLWSYLGKRLGIVLVDLGFFGLERMSREGHVTN